MSICYYCARRLSFWHFKCRTCRCFSWRAHHVLVIILGGLAASYFLLWLVY